MRVIVSVAWGNPRYVIQQNRLISQLPGECLMLWRDPWLPWGCPEFTREDGDIFKVYAIENARQAGFDTILWMDSSVTVLRPLAPLWELIESQGYWFSLNLPIGDAEKEGRLEGPKSFDVEPWNCGQWCCDAALEIIGMTREEAFGIPQIMGGAFGLDFRHDIAKEFLAELSKMQKAGAFRGPRENDQGQASPDTRVLGHRTDQTSSSVIAHRLGMKLTKPPAWIVDGGGGTEETVLDIRRWSQSHIGELCPTLI